MVFYNLQNICALCCLFSQILHQVAWLGGAGKNYVHEVTLLHGMLWVCFTNLCETLSINISLWDLQFCLNWPTFSHTSESYYPWKRRRSISHLLPPVLFSKLCRVAEQEHTTAEHGSVATPLSYSINASNLKTGTDSHRGQMSSAFPGRALECKS